MPKFEGARERLYIELEHNIVTPRTGADAFVLTKGFASARVFDGTEHSRTIKALRVDVVVGDLGAGGYNRAFANVLAGLRATVQVGGKAMPSLTFVRGLFLSQNNEPSENRDFSTYNADGLVTSRRAGEWVFYYDLAGTVISKKPTSEIDEVDFVNGVRGDYAKMQHGINGPVPKDYYAPAGQSIALEIAYDGVDVPVSFMRVVLLGVITRDIA